MGAYKLFIRYVALAACLILTCPESVLISRFSCASGPAFTLQLSHVNADITATLEAGEAILFPLNILLFVSLFFLVKIFVWVVPSIAPRGHLLPPAVWISLQKSVRR